MVMSEGPYASSLSLPVGRQLFSAGIWPTRCEPYLCTTADMEERPSTYSSEKAQGTGCLVTPVWGYIITVWQMRSKPPAARSSR